MAQEWAEARGVPCDVFMAQWAEHTRGDPAHGVGLVVSNSTGLPSTARCAETGAGTDAER